MSILQEIQDDCNVLLERALCGKLVCAFGEDGCGQFGRSSTPKFFTIDDITVLVEADDEDYPVIISALVIIKLSGYDAEDVGCIMTDKNFEISIRQLLDDADIPSNTLTWGSFDDQSRDSVVMTVDIDKLLA